jgi:hypothetical protein
VSFKICIQFSSFHISTRINCNRISVGLLYALRHIFLVGLWGALASIWFKWTCLHATPQLINGSRMRWTKVAHGKEAKTSCLLSIHIPERQENTQCKYGGKPSNGVEVSDVSGEHTASTLSADASKLKASSYCACLRAFLDYFTTMNSLRISTRLHSPISQTINCV